jgi:uncharacterized membrane protein (UPF0127 family)
MTRTLRALLALALALAACGNGTPPAIPGARLPVRWLSVGPHRITAEVAIAPDERNRGLMFRESMPPDHGMLFVFPAEKVLAFWMRNTTLPLSVAYADARGRIVRIADLVPLDEHPISSVVPARYALEMNRGWFAAHAVVVGDRITGIPE